MSVLTSSLLPHLRSMNRLPPGRLRPILVIVAIVVAIALGLEMLGHRLPALHSLLRDAITIVIAIGIVAVIRSLVPRREERRTGDRRHRDERRVRT